MQWTKALKHTDDYINSTFYSGVSTQGEGIDLRIETNRILYGGNGRVPKGHWVILRRYNYNKKSEFYNETTKEGVGGPGYEYTDELLRTRRIPASRSPDYNGLKAGGLLEDSLVYYFEYTVKPKVGQDIFELDLDDHSKKPKPFTYKLEEKYKIKRVHPYRLENGNVQYYTAMVERDEVRYG